jgi:hypothetical protein
VTAATMIRTYHEYASVGKRFESGQFPHRPIGTKLGESGQAGFGRMNRKEDIVPLS